MSKGEKCHKFSALQGTQGLMWKQAKLGHEHEQGFISMGQSDLYIDLFTKIEVTQGFHIF